MGFLRISLLALVVGCSSRASTPPPKSPEPPPPAPSTTQAATEVPPAQAESPSDDPPPPEEEDAAPPAPTQKPASITAAHIATADALVALMTKLSSDLQAAGTDCKAGARVLTGVGKQMAKMKPDLDKLEATTKSDPQAKAWIEENYFSKLISAMGPVMSIAQTCGKDPEFQKALKALDAGN